MIVVLDSGIWISALQFGGTPLRALEKAFVTDRPAICDGISDEVTRVLTKKMGWEANRVAESFGIYLLEAIWVPVRGKIKGVCRDPKDDMVFECAVNARAGLIVSGDKDLLGLGTYHNIRILSAREYVFD